MKRLFFWITSVLPLMLLISCAPAARPAPTPTPRPPSQPQAQGTNQDAEKDLPQLAGGSEAEVRQPQPVSNYLLQRKYPHIMVLTGSKSQNKVALTWDDGPDRRFTPQILDVLKRHGVKGTFFVMGSRAAAIPEVIKRMHNEGHVIGNHSYWHPNLAKGTVAAMQWEVGQTDNVIQKLTGKRPTLFRAPYGNLNEDLVKSLAKMNKHIVGWSVDSLDWRQLPDDEVERNVLSNVHPGSIILMHSGGNWNQSLQGGVDALDAIIVKLKKDGMQFVTIPELIK